MRSSECILPILRRPQAWQTNGALRLRPGASDGCRPYFLGRLEHLVAKTQSNPGRKRSSSPFGPFSTSYAKSIRGITYVDQSLFSSRLDSLIATTTKEPSSLYLLSYTENTANNINQRTGVIVTGGSLNADDINISETATVQQIDLGSLAEELARLRAELKSRAANSSDASQDTAIGQVALAETAARSGDRRGALAALKSAGTWVLNVAKDIGVELAAKTISGAIGLGPG